MHPGRLSTTERETLRRDLERSMTGVFHRGEVLVAATRLDDQTAVYRATPGEGPA